MCDSCGFLYWNNSRPTAGAVVEDASGRVLLGRRGIEPSKGLWDLPGGFLEPGEHPEAGMKRELWEETGLLVDPVKLLGFYMDQYGDDPHEHTLNIFYLCRVMGGEAQASDDMAELGWFAPDALPTNPELAFQNVIKALRDWKEIKNGT
jgi:ADP-ribose pyrophosphatase YjhB (NUDIX family)